VLDAFSQKRNAALRKSNLRMATVAGLTCIAALALFALLLIHRGRPVSSPEGARPSTPSAPTANATNGRQEASAIEPAALGAAQTDVLSAFEDEDDAAGSFVPLTKSFDPTTLDGGAVVRVEMSRTALQQFGLSPSQNNDKPVLADMVVTSDGTPQAIRLVDK
jgi:hypothetical protein